VNIEKKHRKGASCAWEHGAASYYTHQPNQFGCEPGEELSSALRILDDSCLRV
jgi:hypothetical protein